MNRRSTLNQKRSATISEFRFITGENTDANVSSSSQHSQQLKQDQLQSQHNQQKRNQCQPKLTKVLPYKVTRSKSVHAFQEYGKGFVGSPLMNSSIKSSQINSPQPKKLLKKEVTPLQPTPPIISPIPNQPHASTSIAVALEEPPLQQSPPPPPPPPPPIHPSPFISNTIDDDNAQTSLSYSSNLLNYCQESVATSNYPAGATKSPGSGIRNTTVIYRKKNTPELDYNLNEISPISYDTNSLRVVKRQSKFSVNSKLEAPTSSNDLIMEKNKNLSPDLEIVMAKSDDDNNSSIEIKQKNILETPISFNNDLPNKSVGDNDSYTSPVSTGLFSNITRRGFWWIIVILLCVIIILIGGFAPAVFILGKGTKTSVGKFFSDPKNLPMLYLLSSKYLTKVEEVREPIIHKPNSIEGLSEELQQDNEVVSLMSIVTNALFSGVAYSPSNALEPQCGFTRRDAMLDLARLSTITTRIRNYGMQCDQSEFILDAIEYMNLNMTLAMGVWIGSNDTVNQEQMDLMKKIISKYPNPSELINSIYIGNEVLFREDKTRDELIEYIQDAKTFLQSRGIDDIPVGTSEIGSLVDSPLLQACEIVGANIHPFFAGVPVEFATIWSLEFLNLQVQPYNDYNTKIVLTEIGWPSGGGTFGSSIASLSNSEYFANDFLCTFRDLPVEYYYFEAFDEPWKEIFWEGNRRWETQWGVFQDDRSPKFALQNIGCV
ncbi:cell wall protein with similarity to glucanases, putative [Candida dubliniensis CD36]|uniref:glucan endo-1,3-beta-D-glucosidase n=1 Tax=Candida dubliniensis (strain CD36 / ATCC MYA-646 / CBS 7987 / NCPF 3949 / NRRL Y-17841) TaxID=573826 RepID=B9WFI4_CANDC|nr:cell wall protein with similarity to glucanases, putative [Candida dubliniensis CD36]CAX42003.1 cell wall protein with similarity to glucanases, putative [Candida dubliniensis CD36]